MSVDKALGQVVSRANPVALKPTLYEKAWPPRWCSSYRIVIAAYLGFGRAVALHYRFIYFATDLLRDPVALFLQGQCVGTVASSAHPAASSLGAPGSCATVRTFAGSQVVSPALLTCAPPRAP